jgi:para-aminobenzoate synthetase component 1
MWDKLNSLGREKKPFLFISDFDANELVVVPLDANGKNLNTQDIEFQINKDYMYKKHKHILVKKPISFKEYKDMFNKVQERIKNGETYLLNLTTQTKVKTSLNLQEIYKTSNAHYKLRYKDKFVCFSPETFIQIKNNSISTFPMKGTIDAKIPQAKSVILANEKEMAEHIMVVDLLRNDLNIVSENVRVKKFRFVKEIDAGEKKLLHVSSHICGDLNDDWHSNIGNILKELLPAGSITGTPKKSTLEIIKKIENYDRGFFSGVFGVYDGVTLDSGVMIRFVEKKDKNFVYKSGGGITQESDARSEYEEMLDKIYIP